jgi:prophage antirepressor-like protein
VATVFEVGAGWFVTAYAARAMGLVNANKPKTPAKNRDEIEARIDNYGSNTRFQQTQRK